MLYYSESSVGTKRLLVVGERVMQATGLGLGMTPFEIRQLAGLVDHSFWVMRCIGYPRLPSRHDGLSCGAHKG